MAYYIAVGGLRNASNITHRLFIDGTSSPLYSFDHYGEINAVAYDSYGNWYAAGKAQLDTSDYSGVYTVRKYDIDGNLLWRRYYHTTTLYGIAVNDAGDVIVVGASSGGKSILKFNSSGTEQWSADHGATTYCVALDASGNVYVGGAVSSSVSIRKYNSSGTQQWTANHAATVRGICLDASGNVYVCGDTASGPYNVRQYDNDGNLNWSRNYLYSSTTGTVYGIRVDSSQNTYICGKTSGVFGIVRKYNSSGTQQYDATYGGGSDLNATPYGIFVTPESDVYVCGIRSASVGEIEKYNSSGTYQTEYTNAGRLNAICAFSLAMITSVPALALAFALGVPGGGRAYEVPGLPIAYSLAIPTSTSPPVPPLGDGQVIYRCYLTGASLIELPIESIECRRRRNQSTWLLLSVPTVTTVQRAAILAAVNVGQLVIYSGLRAGDGTETLGEFLRATLTETDETLEPWNAGMILTARVAAVLETLQTRTLEGVYQRSDASGRKSISCVKVNPVLRPGDTVTDGDWSFIADSVTYKISAFSSDMTVREAP